MILHVLPGDAVAERFRDSGLEGEIVVCRECLVDGPVLAESLPSFWLIREQYLSEIHPDVESDYSKNVIAELEKLQDLSASDEINLWFENELFCQTNLWFCMTLLADSPAAIYRVSPRIENAGDKWQGFGGDLRLCFDARTKLNSGDRYLGMNLWSAYSRQDHTGLLELGRNRSDAFPFLEEVCEAAAVKETLPQKIVEDILREGQTDFPSVFNEFSRRAGVYGFGDEQVKQILSKTKNY